MGRLIPSNMVNLLVQLPRWIKRAVLLGTDFFSLMFAVWAAYSLRLGEFAVLTQQQLLLMFAAPVVAMPVFLKLGLYRSVIRFLGEHALWAVVKGMSLASLLWAGLAFMTQMTGAAGVPRSVPLLYWLLGLMLIGSSRFLARWILWIPTHRRYGGKQVLIYGAGASGRQLAASLRAGRSLFPAGFLDDNAALHGEDVDGLRVYAPGSLPRLMDLFDISDVIVTLSSASSARRREVVSFLEEHGVRVRILPSMTDIASGRHLVNMVREVDIGDLLGRDPVAADPTLLGGSISGKVVMVTGAGGSIGSELCHQIAAIGPAKLVLLEASEHALYQIDRKLRAVTRCELISCLGSVCDANLVFGLISKNKIQTIYHAAAHKHVPLVESNVIEGVRNNVLGTKTLAEAAFQGEVETFVLISTDKAVRPTNVMGATKRWAELVVQDLARSADPGNAKTQFCAVRFGNVLGSSGSVIPLFKEQIATGGPVTVTDSEVTRYFMSIHEAVQLVIQAGSLAQNGEVFLLDMGEPVKIIDLAHNLIQLSGKTVRDSHNPEGDIEIVFTGLRPGEKLYEELLIEQNAAKTSHPRIMKASEIGPTGEALDILLAELENFLSLGDADAVRALLVRNAFASGEAAETESALVEASA